MPEWIISLLIGGVIVSLMGVIYKGVLTKSDHAQICQANSRELMKGVKDLINERMDDLKESMNKDIKIAILEGMKAGENRV